MTGRALLLQGRGDRFDSDRLHQILGDLYGTDFRLAPEMEGIVTPILHQIATFLTECMPQRSSAGGTLMRHPIRSMPQENRQTAAIGWL